MRNAVQKFIKNLFIFSKTFLTKVLQLRTLQNFLQACLIYLLQNKKFESNINIPVHVFSFLFFQVFGIYDWFSPFIPSFFLTK